MARSLPSLGRDKGRPMPYFLLMKPCSTIQS